MRITLRRPDDWHLHLRDGEMLAAVLPHTATVADDLCIVRSTRRPASTGPS